MGILFRRSHSALIIFAVGVVSTLFCAWMGLRGLNAEAARVAIERGGYWHAWLVTILYWGLAGPSSLRWAKAFFRMGGHRRISCWYLALGVLAASVWLHLHQPHQFKVMADEVNLLNISQAMHEHRYVYSPGRMAMRDGVVIAEAGHLDKRPYFFSFLVSIIHDATGYRPANALILNGLLTPLLIAGFWLLGRRLDKRLGGAVAVMALCLLPILAHVVTSGGFELYNLTLIIWTWVFGLRAWDKPNNRRMALAAVSAAALAMGRYESILYAVPVAVVLMAAAGRITRAGGRLSPWLAGVPWLFLPALLLIQISFSREDTYFQWAAKKEAGTFSIRFFPDNFRSAVEFFVLPHPLALGAPLMFLLGLCGWALFLRPEARGVRPADKRAWWVGVGFALATMANVLIFLFFNYGAYAEFITQRISLPVFAVAVVGVVWLVKRTARHAERWLLVGLAGFQLVACYLPMVNRDYWFKSYFPAREFAFIQRTVDELGERRYGTMVLSSWTGAWVACRVYSEGFGLRGEGLEFLWEKQRNMRVSRIWLHVIEGTEEAKAGEFRLRVPDWIDRVRKREVARQWLREGGWSVIYEILGPVESGVALPPPEASVSSSATFVEESATSAGAAGMVSSADGLHREVSAEAEAVRK